MRKFVRTYSPFLVYFVCVALAYFLCFYLFPKYNAALAYLGFLIIYTYIDIGVFILGFFMGKIIVKRSIDISFLLCLIYALISFGLMLLIGSLKYVFYDYMYSNFTFTFSIFIESLGDRDSLFVSIGTFISFFIGEIIECFKWIGFAIPCNERIFRCNDLFFQSEQGIIYLVGGVWSNS